MSTITRESGDTARAFDAAADAYDEQWESLPATRRLRRIIHTVLDGVFPAGSAVLELNAGTGTDALHLAGRGVRVLATDISPRMVEVTERKAARAGAVLETAVIGLEELGTLHTRRFDGVLSSMGGLNCIRDLHPFARQVATLVMPGSAVVLGFMPAFSLWESATFAARGRWRDAFRRRARQGISAPVGGEMIPVWYHAPSAVASAFSPWFSCTSVRGLNVVSPPPGSTAAARHRRLVRILDRCDDVLGRFPPFSRAGDHCLMVFRRATTPDP